MCAHPLREQLALIVVVCSGRTETSNATGAEITLKITGSVILIFAASQSIWKICSTAPISRLVEHGTSLNATGSPHETPVRGTHLRHRVRSHTGVNCHDLSSVVGHGRKFASLDDVGGPLCDHDDGGVRVGGR